MFGKFSILTSANACYDISHVIFICVNSICYGLQNNRFQNPAICPLRCLRFSLHWGAGIILNNYLHFWRLSTYIDTRDNRAGCAGDEQLRSAFSDDVCLPGGYRAAVSAKTKFRRYGRNHPVTPALAKVAAERNPSSEASPATA